MSMQKVLREKSAQINELEAQLKTQKGGNGEAELKAIQQDLNREKQINLNNNVIAKKFALRILKQYPIKKDKQNLFKGFNCFLQNSKIKSYMEKQGNAK